MDIKTKCFRNLSLAILCTMAVCTACGGRGESDRADSIKESKESPEENAEGRFVPGNTVKTRYDLPQGYHRVQTEKGSFEEYLQNLPLKPKGYPTHLYDGTEKERKVSTSVIDMNIDSVDLQHSADAIIRLRAEYLYKTGQFDKIHFNFTNGFRCDYPKWAQGFRVRFNGKRARWYRAADGDDYSYPTFREYLRTVFAHADERSLAKEMRNTDKDEFGIGTVIFNPRHPRHAAIVVDMLRRDSNDYCWGDLEVVLLAQGGNPAQEIEIIQGNGDEYGLFKESRDIYRSNTPRNLWITPSYGERRLNLQGGRLLTVDYDFNDKQLKNF